MKYLLLLLLLLLSRFSHVRPRPLASRAASAAPALSLGLFPGPTQPTLTRVEKDSGWNRKEVCT